MAYRVGEKRLCLWRGAGRDRLVCGGHGQGEATWFHLSKEILYERALCGIWADEHQHVVHTGIVDARAAIMQPVELVPKILDLTVRN